MNKKKPDLEIIVVNYNSQFWLKKTLTTLQTYFLNKTQYAVTVTVVDNGSEDESLAMLKQEFRWVFVQALAENVGYAAANNHALKLTKARYVMLLNSDVEFTQTSQLDKLLDFMEANPAIGIITPRIEFSDGSLDPACHRGEPTPWVSFTYFSGLERLFPSSTLFGEYHQSYKDLFTRHEVAACSGAAMILRTTAMKKVGLLDERFFMYAEDLDWCKRFREAGFNIVYFPEVIVIHHKYKSGIKNASQQIARKTRKHFYNTMLQYYDKHYRKTYPEVLRTLIKYFLVIKKGAV